MRSHFVETLVLVRNAVVVAVVVLIVAVVFAVSVAVNWLLFDDDILWLQRSEDLMKLSFQNPRGKAPAV